MERPRALVLDYGQVLCGPQRADSLAKMAARLHASPEAFTAAYWAERPAYDAGDPPGVYSPRVAERLGRAELATAAAVEALVEDDVASWCDFREEVWTIAGEFRARGGRLGFLSNNIPPLMARLRADRRIDEVFDVVVASCEVGLMKPSEAIFLHCLAGLGVAPADALFADDLPANVAAAERIGMAAFLFDGEAAVERLRERIAAFCARP